MKRLPKRWHAHADGVAGRLAGWTILLSGELGAGKSTFARALIRALGHTARCRARPIPWSSPTMLPVGHVYHVDLYRVSDEEELRYLGWNELETAFGWWNGRIGRRIAAVS